jgi:hypothetical protein
VRIARNSGTTINRLPAGLYEVVSNINGKCHTPWKKPTIAGAIRGYLVASFGSM